MSSEDDLAQAQALLAREAPEQAAQLLRSLLARPLDTAATAARAAHLLAGIERRGGRLREAIELWQGALLLAPDDGAIWADLGRALLEADEPHNSLVCFERSESLEPARPEVLHDHAVALLRAGRPGQAVERFQAFLQLRPEDPQGRLNLGWAQEALAHAHFDAGLPETALETLAAAIALRLPPAERSAGSCLDPAERDLLAALHHARGIVWQGQGCPEQALRAYEQALAVLPERADSHFHLSLVALQAGQVERGWREYEWRFRRQPPARLCADVRLPRLEQPAAAQTSLLLIGEQGLGDMLQFLRYVPRARSLAENVSLCLPECLLGLVGSSGPAVPLLSPQQAEAISAGVMVPLLSLPLRLALEAEPLGAACPYLQLPRQQLLFWRQRLRGGLAPGERLLAVHWQGNPQTEQSLERGRSFPLELLRPIAELPGIRLLSLQRGFGEEQWRTCSFRARFVDDQEQLDGIRDFLDIAAMASACDLVISSDSAVAHLAGALALPTWLLLRQAPDWRWGLQADRTPWYPSLRLFRQPQPGDWDAVVQEVVRALRAAGFGLSASGWGG